MGSGMKMPSSVGLLALGLVTALLPLAAGSVFSVIDIEDDFYFSNPKVHHKSYYMKPQVPRGSLPIKIRNGDEVLPLWLPSTEYRWLAGQAITPVLRYTGHDQYLATVLGDGHVLQGREEATQYLRQLRDSLLPPSYLAPHLDVVFIVWASDSRGSTTTPTPVGKASDGPLKGLPPTQKPTIRPVEIPTLPPYPSPIPGGVPSASPSFRTRTDSPRASFPTISPTPRTTSPPVAPPTVPTQPPTLPAEPPTVPTEPPTFPTEPPTQIPTPPTKPPTPPTESPILLPITPPTRRPRFAFPTSAPSFFNRPFNIGSLNIDDLINSVIQSGRGTVTRTSGSTRNVTRTRTQTRSASEFNRRFP